MVALFTAISLPTVLISCLVITLFTQHQPVLGQQYLITTAFGSGYSTYNGDSQATSAQFFNPRGIATTSDGSFIVADSGNCRVRIIYGNGTIATLAGNGQAAHQGDGLNPLLASFYQPHAVAVSPINGNVFISDTYSSMNIRMIANNTIKTIAGSTSTGSYGYDASTGAYGDGGLATSAILTTPSGVAVGLNNLLYISDPIYNCIRAVNLTTNTITTIGGNFTFTPGYSGDGVLATQAQFFRYVM